MKLFSLYILKHTALTWLLFCLALNARAQQTQQADSIITSPWVRANTPSPGWAAALYLSYDTCWGADNFGALISTDGGLNWQRRMSSQIGEYFLNAHDAYSFGASTYRTTNAGLTWDSIGPAPPTKGFATIVDSLHIFVSGQYISRTTNGGKSWTLSNPVIGTGPIGFANSMVGYSVGGEIQGPLPSQIGLGCLKTVDGGNTWNQIYTGIPGDAYGIAVIDSLNVIVVGDELIYRTTDGGISWNQITWNNPTPGESALLGICLQNGIGYISGATGGGNPSGLILRSTDTGKTWSSESSDVNTLLYDPEMYAGSIAAVGGDSGIFIRNGNLAGISSPSVDSLSILIFPNPSQLLVTLSYNLPSPQTVTLTIYDINGNIIDSPLTAILQNAGNHQIPINTAGFAPGTYYYQLNPGMRSANGSFVIIK
jgi:photosystem II stability/assembly factor-like uncharacterized protein